MLVVGREDEAEAGWLECSVEGWATEDDLASGGLAALERVLFTRRVLRPSHADTPGVWLDALRSLTRSDAVAQIESGKVTSSGDPVFEAIWSNASLLQAAARAPVVVSSAAGAGSRFGLPGTVDSLVALPLGPRGAEGVLILGVRERGGSWIRSALALARAATEAAERLSLQRRLAAAETEQRRLHGAMSRFVAMVSHDLRSPLFAIQLGVKVLERQSGPSQSVVVLNRAVGSASDLLRRLVEAGRAVLDPPKRLTGTADLTPIWTRVLGEVQAQNPTAVIAGDGPGPEPIRVAVDAASLESLVRTLLGNAVVHGAGAPVRVAVLVPMGSSQGDSSQGDSSQGGSASLVLTNTGRLPFSELAALEPFEHRSSGGLGASLFTARNIAAAAGVDLRIVQNDMQVEATLGLKLAP